MKKMRRYHHKECIPQYRIRHVLYSVCAYALRLCSNITSNRYEIRCVCVCVWVCARVWLDEMTYAVCSKETITNIAYKTIPLRGYISQLNGHPSATSHGNLRQISLSTGCNHGFVEPAARSKYQFPSVSVYT